MDILDDIGLSRVLPPDLRRQLTERLESFGAEQLPSRKLSAWFANFASSTDKLLAAKMLAAFTYYSTARYEQQLHELGNSLTQAMRNHGDAPRDSILVVDEARLDSSRVVAYFASKDAGWNLREEQILTGPEISEIPTGVALIVLNDTQGSGNQFKREIWPHVEHHVRSGIRLYLACFELSEVAYRELHSLSDNIVFVPDTPTAHCLEYMFQAHVFNADEHRRIVELSARAHPQFPLGYGDCALMVAYHYQCPNNTLPVFWGMGTPTSPWTPLFEYRKKPDNKKGSADSLKITVDSTAPLQATDEFNLRQVIGEEEWIIGAVNFDEDLHFSSFYLRASCASFMPEQHRRFGYSSLIAIYRDFNETYYIKRAECEAVSRGLVDRIKSDPRWLQEILDQIAIRAMELGEVFPYEADSEPFKNWSIEQIRAIYIKHNKAHARLYEVARIPEALDRGLGIFEEFLRDDLRRRLGKRAANQKVFNNQFNTLTFPEKVSSAQAELVEFRDLVLEVRRYGQRAAFTSSSRRTILKLPPHLRAKIDSHRDKWSFWGYHGYGSRALPDMEHYMRRISSELESFDEQDPHSYEKVMLDAEVRRKQLIKSLNINKDLELMYRLHSRIGLMKLLRRYHQLRNFYFLDQLLLAVSNHLGVPEAEVRCLLPSELEAMLAGGEPIDSRTRTEDAVYVMHDGSERVFAGSATRTLVEELLLQVVSPHNDLKFQLTGTTASPGVVRGRCKKIIRLKDAETVRFRPGDILVSEATDPDLYELIRQAGGVITESGGAACHAAIVCRELGKPAIVGVRNALSRLKDDELIVLDADRGLITLQKSFDRRFTVDDVSAAGLGKEIVGSKAANLSKLLAARIPVPSFFCIPWKNISEVLDSLNTDSGGADKVALAAEIEKSLEYLAGDMFMLRSSMSSEDESLSSEAGWWPSESAVLRADVAPELLRYLDRFRALDRASLVGSIIVQEMILGDASGVCFTRDPIGPDFDRMLLEVIPGGNELLTDGMITPVRYFVARDTKLITLDEGGQRWGEIPSNTQLSQLANVLQNVETVFSGAQDIEWTMKLGQISILQTRPITGRASAGLRRDGRPRSAALDSVSSLYRAFRVPPNLQLHLLRVSAVAALICKNWVGPKINASQTITACLLHDIGNIVKADYDRFPDLFPEEMKNLGYWKMVQGHVRQRFGHDDLEATLRMAETVGVPDSILRLIREKQFVRNEKLATDGTWEAKIAAYSDQRVGPHGVLPLEERFAEAKRRYRGVQYASVNRPDYEKLVHFAFEIERQLSEFCGIGLGEITDDAIEALLPELRSLDVRHTSAST